MKVSVLNLGDLLELARPVLVIYKASELRFSRLTSTPMLKACIVRVVDVVTLDLNYQPQKSLSSYAQTRLRFTEAVKRLLWCDLPT